MASNEEIKAAILKEIEETAVGDSATSNESDDSFSDGTVSDFVVSLQALRRAKTFGVDPRYSDPAHKPVKKSPILRAQQQAVLDEQLEVLLSQLDILNGDTRHPSLIIDEDDELGSREKVASIRLPYQVFAPLLQYLRETKPAVFQVLKVHTFVTGSASGKRRKSNRSRHRKRREREQADKEQGTKDATGGGQSGGVESDAGAEVDRTSAPQRDEPKINPRQWRTFRQYLAVLVAKCVADASLQGYLIVLYLLQLISVSDNLGDDEEPDTVRTIPVGNVLGALFDSTSSSAAREPSQQDGLTNPFWGCLIRSSEASRVPNPFWRKSTSMPGSILSAHVAHEDYQQSDAGSHAGSNMAEQGTETASIIDAEEDEELSEEELLMQALALSLNPSSTNVVSTASVPSDAGSDAGSCTSSAVSGVLEMSHANIIPLIPERLVEADPVSAQLPFSYKEFWTHAFSLEPSSTVGGPGTFAVPIEHVISALLVQICYSADAYVDSTKLDESASFLAPKVSAETLTFLLLEGLMGMYAGITKSPSTRKLTPSFGEKTVLTYFSPIWSQLVLLKVLRATFKLSTDSGINPSSLGFSMVGGDVRDSANVPFAQKIANAVIDCISQSCGVFGASGATVDWYFDVARQIYSPDIVFMFVQGISVTALDALVSGFYIFHQSKEERILLLRKLMRRVTWANGMSQSFQMPVAENEMSCSLYYTNYFLQNLCGEYASLHAKFDTILQQVEYNPDSRSYASILDKVKEEHVEKSSLYQHQQLDIGTLNNKFLAEYLLDRLSYPDIMKFEMNQFSVRWYKRLAFWGELSLLRSFYGQVLGSLEGSTEKPRFDDKRCHPSLQISPDGLSAAHTSAKGWYTVVTTVGYAPRTGVHEWTIFINRCEKGHVFLGIVTAEASVDTYIGGDSFGWGLIGTRALWHNKAKVGSDYGRGFEENSVIKVTYDSDQGLLYFAGEKNEWGVAFKSLPSTTIFPAVSLHQREDRVTIRKLSHGLPASESLSTNYLFSDFIGFSHSLCLYCDKILVVDDQTPQEIILRVTSHPFLTVLLPSLASSLITTQPESHYLSSICMNLCGDLVIILKRLVYAHDRREPLITCNHKESGFIGPLSNSWYVKRNNTQDYELSLDLQECFAEPSDKEVSKFRRYVKLRGKASDNSVVDSISGVAFGTRVLFNEIKAGNIVTEAEGRISLDGSQILGTFKDIKSGVSGKFEAVALSSVPTQHNILYRSALLTTMVLTKLTSHMINGLDFSEGPLIKDDDTNVDSQENKTSAVWLNSELLSGGLKLSQNELRDLTSAIFLTDGATERQNPTRSWWVSQVFPKDIMESHSFDTTLWDSFEASDSIHAFIPKFPNDLEKVICSHIGASPFIKLGGEPINNARQKVICILIKHTGTEILCAEEEKAYLSGLKSEQDRPSSILMDIWIAGKLIVEEAIRRARGVDQTQSVYYSLASSTLMKKTNFLGRVDCNTKCKAISRSLESAISELVSRTPKISEVATNLQQDVAAIVKVVQEFYAKPMKIEELSDMMASSKIRAIYRAAALRTIFLLTQKTDIDEGKHLASVNTLPLLLAMSLGGIQSALQKGEMFKSSGSEISGGNDQGVSSLKLLCGHYSDNLPACGTFMADEVRSVFEKLYEYSSKLLERCIFSCDKEAQYVALLSWHVKVHPVDHSFLNRIGIFRILQTILDDSRANVLSRDSTLSSDHLANNLLFNSNRRVVKLVLYVVYSLASQIALVKEQVLDVSVTTMNSFQKIASGPDTLSKSLFSMLFNEMYLGIRGIMQRSSFLDVSLGDVGIDETFGYNLTAELHVSRILKLLYLVSDSPMCHHVLTSPKWLYLLLSSIGYGPLILQRRLYRLLRKLMSLVHPNQIRFYMPALIEDKLDVIENIIDLDDDDDLSSVYETDDVNSPMNRGISAPMVIVQLFFDAITILVPSSSIPGDRTQRFYKYLMQQSTTGALVAESLSILRLLQENLEWSSVITSAVNHSLLSVSSDDNNSLRQSLACLAVLGGHIDRLWLGGIVILRPLTLTTGSDSYAVRVASANHTCGLLLSRNLGPRSAEIVLLERHRRSCRVPQKTDTLASFSVSHPIRPVKMNEADFVSSSEILPNPASSTIETIDLVLKTVKSVGFASFLADGESESKYSDLTTSDSSDEFSVNKFNMNIMRSSLFRSLAILCQNQLVLQSFSANIEIFEELIALSKTHTSYCSLASIEYLEDYFTRVWDSYLAASGTCATFSVQESSPSPPPESHDPFFQRLLEREASRSEREGMRANGGGAAPASGNIFGIGRTPPPSTSDQSQQSGVSGGARMSSSLLELFGAGSRHIDPAIAVQQMMEMGFPQEWCEVALRRCRYNLELAINLCFERQGEMAMLVDEDREMQAAALARQQQGEEVLRREEGLSMGLPDSVLEAAREIGGEVLRDRLLGHRAARRTPSGGRPLGVLVKQLQDMGFPERWCLRALEATQNNADAALSWILSHASELEGPPPQEEIADEGTAESTVPVPNPLVSISGSSSISPDLVCTGSSDESFPSVGCRGFGVSSGKWYYEVTLLTTNCIQVGWVDGEYTGDSRSGQGVGDDANSWAFDGWRVYLWHEVSIDWGARWAVGDVVGCAIDMDQKVMRFTLNGFGEEIGMGDAFVGFQNSGPVYPCVSFNKQERLKFNFGHSALKYLPEGYQPYSDRIDVVFKNFGFDSGIILDDVSAQGSQTRPAIYEDGIEDSKGESDFRAKRRFFVADESSKFLNAKPPYVPVSKIPTSIPSSKKEILEQLEKVSKDLSVLYARLAVLRVISLTNACEDSNSAIFRLLASNTSPAMDDLLHVIKLSSMYSSRTKIYLQTMSISFSSSSMPSNLGPIFYIGGPPVLNILAGSFKNILAAIDPNEKATVISKIMGIICSNIKNSTLREYSLDWHCDNSTCPYIIREGPLTDEACANTPSLCLSYWFSKVLLEYCIREFNTPEAVSVLFKLTEHWVFAMRSASLHVKLCAIRFTAYLLQEAENTLQKCGGDFSLPELCALFPYERLREMLVKRVKRESPFYPIQSEYLQALVELIIVLDRFSARRLTNADSAFNKVAVDNDWETCMGFAHADYGWKIWTGQIRQHKANVVGNLGRPRPSSSDDRNHMPPEVMPGSNVMRKITRLISVDEQPVESDAQEIQTSTVVATQETIEEIGLVVDIITWPGSYPGSGRRVKWADGECTEIKWGADGEYGADHVRTDKDGKVLQLYPAPYALDSMNIPKGFGEEISYGVILRRMDIPRKAEEDPDILVRFVGYLELPYFGAVVLVDGIEYNDHQISMTETKLVRGPSHTGWSERFGHSYYKAGTTYELGPPLHPDILTEQDGQLLGDFQYTVKFACQSIQILGDISLQQRVLFRFDDKMRSQNMIVSRDRTMISLGSGSKGLAFADIGFSTGVHYWEFKIEQADLQSTFIGVSERISHGSFSRWTGYGIVNRRITLKSVNRSESIQIYGRVFSTGDTVGVMLDMERGRLSFFLDGMQFGEHILEDMGDAFDSLTSGSTKSTKTRTFYPVVGLNRSNSDRIAITPRWISTVGIDPRETVDLITRVSGLLFTWNVERPSTTPLDQDMWVYRDAWKDWHRWRQERYLRVRCRCRGLGSNLILDTHPAACVRASVMLGLSTPLFTGDRLLITSSAGRVIDAREEAIVLGAYDGRLFYRLDIQRGGENSSEGASLVWMFCQYDMDKVTIVSRGRMYQSLRDDDNASLAKTPKFQGTFLRVIYESGAVMRNGLEIDTSDEIHKVEPDAIVYALERRINSSNVARYLIYYKGSFGWISERIRGSSEEPMVKRLTKTDIPDKWESILEAINQVENLPENVQIILRSPSVETIEEAVALWLGSKLQPEEPIPPFESFVSHASTIDGSRQWSVEEDMRLSELISKISARDGVLPCNMSYKSFSESLRDVCQTETSPFFNVDVNRLLTRASVLKVANQALGTALPFLSLSLPEGRASVDTTGCSGEIEIITSLTTEGSITPSDGPLVRQSSHGGIFPSEPLKSIWSPPCIGRRLRSLRRLLFTTTKQLFWDSVLEATTTPTALPEDEYEDPKEIKTITINRVKATKEHLEAIPNVVQRLRQSVFGQLHREVRNWSHSSFRRAYLMRGHGGQKRAFKVAFQGEGVNDYGGPYREVIEEIVSELQSHNLIGTKPSETCLLPLLVPCSNRYNKVGLNQDKFVLSPAPSMPFTQEMIHFFGKLMGMAIRQNLNLGLDLSATFWRPLVGLPITRAHLETIDCLLVSQMKQIEKQAILYEAMDGAEAKSADFQPPEWKEYNFSAFLSDGTKCILSSNGEETPVTLKNWREYVYALERLRLKESSLMHRVLRDGLGTVVPVELFPLFTQHEMEVLITGNTHVDINILQKCAEYEGFDANSDTINYFWEVLSEMSEEERTLFLRFVWARSRMPSSVQDLQMNFKIQEKKTDHGDNPDRYLPHAQTCFFLLSLPRYSNKEILREKLLYAILNSPNMDADVRLHNAEGWNDA